MARGKQTNDKLYFKIAYENNNKDKGQPFFAEQKKVNDSWQGVSEDTFLEGKLIGISKSSYEYKGEKQHTFELLINGGDEIYALQLNYGYFTRAILNSLASVEDIKNTVFRFEIYRNKEGYVNVAVKANGERTDWLLDHKKLPTQKQEKWFDSFDYFISEIEKRIPVQQEPLKKDIDMDAEPLSLEEEYANKGLNDSETEDDLPF